MEKCRVVNLRKAPYDVYIGRGSKWGNPFRMRNNSEDERNRVCDAYEKYFYMSGLKHEIRELKGKTLGCYCKPLRCHGDFLVKLVNQLEEIDYKDDKCIICGDYVPEGQQVCPACKKDPHQVLKNN